MTETGWQAIGRIAKARRERLRLRQDELAAYKGPKVATVGKFERAAQGNFPLRTQQQMEAALGWPAGTIADFVEAWESTTVMPSELHEWGRRLVEENLPDTRRPDLVSPTNLSGVPQDAEFEDHVLVLRRMLSIVPPDHQSAAMLAATRELAKFAAGRAEVHDKDDGVTTNDAPRVAKDEEELIPPVQQPRPVDGPRG